MEMVSICDGSRTFDETGQKKLKGTLAKSTQSTLNGIMRAPSLVLKNIYDETGTWHLD